MTRPLFRLLGGANSSTTASAFSPTPPSTSAYPQDSSSDFFINLAVLLCTSICMLGLFSLARFIWLRCFSSRGGSGIQDFTPGAIFPRMAANNMGLKKKILRSLPKHTFSPEYSSAARISDCAICLMDFAAGDELRLLPPCGHSFHVACIDEWFRSHSSCPSCRRIPMAVKCKKCGGGGAVAGSSGAGGVKEEMHANTDGAVV